MSALRTLGACALSLITSSTALLLLPEPGSAVEAPGAGDRAASTSVRRTDTQRVRLEALPAIVQPGRSVARAGGARAAFTATYRPIRPGRQVRLQVWRGGSWRTVDTAREDRRGRAELAGRSSRRGHPLTYRVLAVAHRDLPALRGRPVSTQRWLTPTWTDQFSGTSLSHAWTHRGQTYQPESLRRCSRGSAKAVRVHGGAVRLSVLRDRTRARKCPARKDGHIAGRYAYRLNGHIGTDQSFSFRYGFAAARIKYPRLRGQHGSFWLQPLGGMHRGSTGHEIDVSEFFGAHRHRTGLFSYIHRYERGRVVKRGTNVPDTFLQSRRDGWGKRYHVFSVQWKPHLLVFRIDGKETWRIGGRISRERQYLILSLLSSDYELPLIRDRQLPQHMSVDWVRVWAA